MESTDACGETNADGFVMVEMDGERENETIYRCGSVPCGF